MKYLELSLDLITYEYSIFFFW